MEVNCLSEKYQSFVHSWVNKAFSRKSEKVRHSRASNCQLMGWRGMGGRHRNYEVCVCAQPAVYPLSAPPFHPSSLLPLIGNPMRKIT